MRSVTIISLLIFVQIGCLTAPDLQRDNINDRNAGIPHINDSRYIIDNSGLIINWIDGSIQNDLYIIEQRILDNTSNELDSLIKVTELEEDRTFFFDPTKDFGYPYTVYIKSRILNGDKIKAEVVDTLNIEFGRLNYRSQFQTDESVIFNWQNLPNIYYSDSVLVEKLIDDSWQTISKLNPRAQSYGYPLESLAGNDRFRISSTVLNYNGALSRASSFEVLVE
jgi:hypothetical protein